MVIDSDYRLSVTINTGSQSLYLKSYVTFLRISRLNLTYY